VLQILPVSQAGLHLDAIKELFSSYQAELNEDLCFQSFDAELENPLLKYGSPKGLLYIALYHNAIAGCIALQPLPNEGDCEMKRLYVKPEYRKYKIGEALVIELLAEAKKIGYKKMKLDTLERLVPAIKLYEKQGFQNVSAYYNNPLSNVVYMEKDLLQ
jgi:putative acetyltransferase